MGSHIRLQVYRKNKVLFTIIKVKIPCPPSRYPEANLTKMKKITHRKWRALPPSAQKLLFYQVLKPDGSWQSVSIPAIFEEEFNVLNDQYKNEKGIPLKTFNDWMDKMLNN